MHSTHDKTYVANSIGFGPNYREVRIIIKSVI